MRHLQSRLIAAGDGRHGRPDQSVEGGEQRGDLVLRSGRSGGKTLVCLSWCIWEHSLGSLFFFYTGAGGIYEETREFQSVDMFLPRTLWTAAVAELLFRGSAGVV